MSKTYNRSLKVDDLIKSALRAVNAYSDGDDPSPEQMEEARGYFNDLVDEYERDGQRIFQREWRTRVFEDTSTVSEGGKFYRCILKNTSENTATWAATTNYSAGDLVIPTVYNGLYYQAQGLGTSSGSEPAFPTIEDETLVDNDITWKAKAGTKPGAGLNWKNYWYEGGDSGSSWAANTSYSRAGDFFLREDELSLDQAYIRLSTLNSEVSMLSTDEYGYLSKVVGTGQPTEYYIDRVGINSNLVRLFPEPSQTGKDGYIFHYLARLKGQSYDGSTDIQFPGYWFKALKLGLVSELSAEYDKENMAIHIAVADKALKKAKKQDVPDTTKFFAPC